MRAEDVSPRILDFPTPTFSSTPFVPGKPLTQRRIALVSSAGLAHLGDPSFAAGASDYRVLDAQSNRPIVMSHVSISFDRAGYAEDQNVVFPLDRLRELARDGEIGSVARFHFSFMGATDPALMAANANAVADALRADGADLALLLPV